MILNHQIHSKIETHKRKDNCQAKTKTKERQRHFNILKQLKVINKLNQQNNLIHQKIKLKRKSSSFKKSLVFDNLMNKVNTLKNNKSLSLK